MLPSMLGKGIISCYYEHYFLILRQGEVFENEGTLLRRSSKFALMDSCSGLGRTRQVISLFCSKVGRNMVVPFVIRKLFRYVNIIFYLTECFRV